ncbi:MAG: polysaccharide deacetylase family protein [Oscillospiraceae bacterium]|nr:polysaccharide deacetylase family protein [Oscillospiraceae bacterium]
MMTRIPIIYYHNVVKEDGFSYQRITADHFEGQMRYIAEHGYRTLFFSELEQPLPERPLIVSFDDGFRSVFENAAPILHEYSIRSNIYLPTAYIGQDSHFMDWDMVRKLRDSGEFEMQAHTHTHADIRTMSAAQLSEEIADSDRLFREELGSVPQAFCMPFGVWNYASLKRLKNEGRYRYLLGSHYGRALLNGREPMLLPRIGISQDDNLDVFRGKISGRYDWKGPLQLARLMAGNLRGARITEYTY